MILTVNVSNSMITLSAWEETNHVFATRVHTNPSKSAEEYAVQFLSMLQLHACSPAQLTGVILSCVVPAMTATVRSALELLYQGRVYTVGPGLKTGVRICTDDPAQLGSEIVCCAAAAIAAGSLPCLLICMDTAISFTLVDESGTVQGGAIAPGLKLSAEALCARTAQLPQIDLSAPVEGVAGKNSVSCVQAGVVIGTACMLDGMVARFSSLVSQPLTCVSTGELAPVVLRHCHHTVEWRPNLLHEGLLLLYRKNAR